MIEFLESNITNKLKDKLIIFDNIFFIIKEFIDHEEGYLK